ncbi:hypothetical protein [Thauera butanivorans]|uniref:hypothetical protein n=1 Tax=Thauera butanivorans TaxID=86174 RepID=UPI0008396D12|nr:hypothetical protein [Thauera butanivorans]
MNGTLLPLPQWLSGYAELRPQGTHPHAGRFTFIVSQLLPGAAQGLEQEEQPCVEALLIARLMLDAGGLPARSGLLDQLDAWLAASLLRLAGWAPVQRRAWWQAETLSIIAEVLSRWTRQHVLLPVSHGQPAPANPDIVRLCGHWAEFHSLAQAAGPQLSNLYAVEISESLLDCAFALGFTQAQSLRGAALRRRLHHAHSPEPSHAARSPQR